jgi:hypothetical protein
MFVLTHDGPEGGPEDLLVNLDGESLSRLSRIIADDQATIYTTPWDNVRPLSLHYGMWLISSL